MNAWLMKTEPDECSIDDALAAPKKITPWTGVRNYQARNYMRDMMRIGDGVLFYHSSCAEPGIAGLAEVASAAYVDPTQFDRKSPYFDLKSDRAAPRWNCVDVRALMPHMQHWPISWRSMQRVGKYLSPMMAAAARKTEPTTRSNMNTAIAIANAALAWSLGNDGSCERAPQTCAEG